MNVVLTVCAALFLIFSKADAAFAFSSPNLFNPSMTAFGNFLTCGGQGYPSIAEGLCDSPFVFREVELDIRATIDPWADGVFILAFEPDHPDPHGHSHDDEAKFKVKIEEAYVTLKKLPVLNVSLAGMLLKAGKFRLPFGRLNQIHLHDLPQSTLPLSMQALLGPHGLSKTGFSGQFLIPTPGGSNALTLTAQVLAGDTKIPAFLGRLAWFWDLAPSHDVELGVSGYWKEDDVKWEQMYGTDVSYKWRPYILGEKQSFLFSNEWYVQSLEKYGVFAWAQYQFNQSTYLGLRYDYRHVDIDIGHAIGGFLTYYTTEFLRLRAGYEAVTDASWSNLRNNFLLEINFIIGSHPVEPYWVNR